MIGGRRVMDQLKVMRVYDMASLPITGCSPSGTTSCLVNEVDCEDYTVFLNGLQEHG